MKYLEIPLKILEQVEGKVSRKAPDPETFIGYGLAGTVARRCRRIFSENSELILRNSEREISWEERRQIIEGFVGHIKERIVMFIDGDVSQKDIGSENSSALKEYYRVRRNKNIFSKNSLTVVFDDGSAFTYSDAGYDAYSINTFNISSTQHIH